MRSRELGPECGESMLQALVNLLGTELRRGHLGTLRMGEGGLWPQVRPKGTVTGDAVGGRGCPKRPRGPGGLKLSS